MKSSTIKLAAAAVIIVAAMIGINHLKSNASIHQKHISAAASSLPETTESGLVRLEIKLPTPVYNGTKEPIRVNNLRKLSIGERPPFLAPIGTTNIALGKAVASTDDNPIIGEIEMITDGDKEAADGSYVELGPLRQHVTIDLSAIHEIYAVIIWHYHKLPRFITNVRTLFNNDIDNSAGFGIGTDMHYIETYEGELIDCLSKGIKARYVRLYSNGNSVNDLNHYIEVEVYGKPLQ